MSGIETKIEYAQLESKLLDLAYRKLNFSLLSAFILILLIVAALWPVVAHGTLQVWLAASAVVMALRILYLRRYLRLGHGDNLESGKWKTGFVIGAAASGLCWGSSVFLLPSTSFDPVTALVIFIIAGVTAYASVTTASVPAAVFAFMMTTLLPLAVWLFSFGEHIYFVMGVITLLYMGSLVILSRQMHQTICNLLISSEQNNELTVALKQVKHAEYAEAQKENDRRNNDLFASFEDIIFFVDVTEEGGFTVASINPAAERAFGFKNAEVHGKRKSELFPSALAARLEAYDQACVDSGQTVHYEEMLEQPSGNRYFSVTHIPIFDAAGKVSRIAAITRDVTERKHTEERLLKSEAQFRRLAENAPDPILRFDRDCRRIYINPAMERLTGTPLAELLNKSPTEAMPVPSTSAIQAQQSIQRVLDTGKPGELEITFTATDGSERTVLNTFMPEFAADGSVETVLCIGRDISARKRMEKILLDSEREYRTLSENLPGNVMRYDRDCRVRYMNKNIEETLGIPVAYALGKTPSEVFSDGMFDELELVLQGVVEKGQAVDYDIIMPDSGKGERYHRMTLVPEKNERGEVIGVLNVGSDITEQKRYEQELLAQAKLEQRLSTLTENVPGFVFTIRVDTNGHTSVPFVSAGVEELFGLRPEDVRHDAAVLRAKYHPDDLPRILTLMEETKRTLVPFRIEIRITNRANEQSWIEIRSMPQRQSDGATEWHGVMHDITERKQYEQALQAQAEMEQRLSSYINSAPGFFFSLRQTPDGQISMPFASDGIKAIYGLQPQDVAESVVAIIELDHPEDLSKKFAAMEKSGRTLVACQVEFRVLNKERGERWVEARSMPQRDADGTIHWHGFMHDITERKEAAKQLELLNYALDHVNEEVFLVEENSDLSYVNGAACRGRDFTREELLKLNITVLDPNFPMERWPHHWQELKENGSLYFETLHTRKDGQTFPVEIRANYFEFDGKGYNLSLVHDITERLESENALKASEKMLQEAQRIAHVGSWDVDMVNDRLVWSDEIFRIWEIDKTQFKATFAAFLETVHPEDRELVAQAYNEAIDNHSLYEVEHRLLFPDGRIKHILERGEPQYDAQGKPVRFIGTSLEITERKRMEVLLQKRESEFRSLAENSPDLIGRFDRECRRLYANRAMAALARKPIDALVGVAPTDGVILAPEYANKLMAGIREVFASGKSVNIDLATVYHDGSTHEFDALLVPESETGGEVETVLLLSRDITERKRMEEKLALRELEFRTLAENSPDPIYRYDRDCRRIYVNAAVGRILGKPLEALIGSTPGDGAILVSEQNKKLMEGIRSVFASGEAKNINVEFVAQDGDHHDYLMALVPERDANGQVMTVLGLARDITEIKKAQKLTSRFMNNMPGFAYSFRITPDGHASFPFVSRGIEEIYGLTPEDVRDDMAPLHERAHPEDRPRIEAAITDSARTMKQFLVEIRVQRPGHPERWIECRAMPEMEPDGSILWQGVMLDINERKHMESALRDQADFQGTLLTAMSDAAVQLMMIENGRVIFIGNRGLARKFGYTDAELDAHPALLDFIHPDDRALVLENYQRRLAGEEIHSNYEMGLITKDGERREFDVAIAIVPNTNPVRIVTIGRDVTERKQAELALSESRNFLNKLIDGIADPIFVKDREHRWLLANEAFCNLLGQPREMLIGKSDYDFFPKEQSDVFWEKDELVFSSGVTNINEEPITGAEGELRYLHTKKTPFVSANGQALLVGVIRDITERKQIEKELKESEQKYRERSGLLNSIFESSSDIVTFALDKSYRYIAFNRKHKDTMRAIWGKEIALGMSMLEDVIGPHADHEAAKQGFDRALSGESFVLEEAYGDEALSRQYWQNSWSPIRTDAGEIIGLTVFCLNITERKQTELKLAQALEFSEGVVNAIPDLLFEVDSEGRYLNVWAQNQELLAAQKELLLGNTLHDVLAPEAAAICMEALREASGNGLSLGKTICINLPHGESWFELSVSKKQGNNPDAPHFLVLSRDITERKQAEVLLKNKLAKIIELKDKLEVNARDLEDQAAEFEAQAVELEASQEQIKLTEAWYRGIVRSAPDGMVVVNESGNIALVNLNIEKMFGYAEGELIGHPIEMLLPPDVRQGHVAKRDGFFAAGSMRRPMDAVVDGLRACRKDGSEFPVDVSLSRLPDADGKTGVICAAIRDITERKRLEAILVAKEHEFRMLVENVPDVVVRYDRECRRLYVNPAWERVNGVSADMVIGKSPLEAAVHVKPIAADYEMKLREVMTSGCSSEIDLVWQNDAGEQVCFALNAIPEFNDEGEVESVLTLARDITERKRMEDALAAREHESRTLVDNSPDNISRYNREIRRTFVNQAFAAVVDGGAAALLGKTPTECPGGPNADLYEAKINEVFETGDNSEFELRWPNSDGREICSHVRLTAERDASGNVISVLTVGRDITELNEHRKRVYQMAFYDSLTSLPNRALFNDRLRQMITDASWHQQLAGVMLLDLDRFKAVNDTLGHPAGDELLREAAARLAYCVRGYDTVARLGGDEFAILLPEIRSGDDLGRVANKIVQSFNEPFLLEGKEVFVTTSVGISVYPADSEDSDDLLKQADSAMYFAKRSGRNNFRFYSKDLTNLSNERLLLEGDLRRGFARGELELYYQPKVGLVNGAMIGSEALLRWNHPQRGMVPPDRFISIAEDCGLIVEIGEWVLRDACRVACEWNDHGKPLHKVAINLSARQFQSNNLVKTVRKVLDETHCYPEWIELEITESLLLDEDGEVLATLELFREMGITIAIDDFGTGYSSLSYLARFPIDTLKIDRSFTSKITDGGHHSELVKAIISIALSLDQKVVAEGVETAEQAILLQTYGCHIAQGYLYSKPVPKLAFEGLPKSFGWQEEIE